MAVDRKEPLGHLLREPLDDERAERLVSDVVARHERGERGSAPTDSGRLPRRLVAVAVAIAIIAGGAWVLMTYRGSEPAGGPLELGSSGALRRVALSATAGSPLRHELADRSTIELWPGTSVHARTNDGRRLELVMSEGRARFDVMPGGARQWSVDTGMGVVEVVGTAFEIQVRDDAASVQVSRGQVIVRSELLAEGPAELATGEELTLRRAQLAASATGASEAHGDRGTPTAEPVAAAEELDDSHADGRPAPTGPRWRRLAGDGDYDGAWELLGEAGVQRLTEGARTMAELLELADVARRSGHPAEAVAPLELAIERYPSDRRAAVAAFTLGRVEADALHRRGRAARAFERCLELGPPAALREAAHGRLALAQAGAGNYDAARRAATEYLRRYPDGRYAGQMRQWVEPR